MRTLWKQSGQATVMTILFLLVLVGMTGAVLDVGAWFRADRKLQANTDAAALAGAQELPDSTALAQARALEYAGKNGGDVEGGDITFETAVLPNDTILIESDRPADGVFTGLFGIDSVQVHARAKARTGVLSSARWVAPIVVNWQHPMLSCAPPPCVDATQIDLMHLHRPGSGTAAGAFGLINLDRSSGSGAPGAATVASWMETGFDEDMDLGLYHSVPSTMFDNITFKHALNARLDTEVLFPIFRSISGSGSTAQYDVIGWVGFVPTRFVASGSTGTVYGSFKRVIWHGIASTSPSQPNFGGYAVALVD